MSIAVSHAGPCACGGIGCAEETSLERTRYFARQLVGPDDLTQDQTYFRQKLRRHNRLMHGWGIVCGAGVRPVQGTCRVVVEPGYLLGPFGDEILIEREVEIDVCREDALGDAGCGDPDPWCAEVVRPPGATLHLAVRHLECPSRPVRVLGHGCGCDDEACEYSRTRDGYAFRLLDTLPASYAEGSKVAPDSSLLLRLLPSIMCFGGPRVCPPCPEEPWLILADLVVRDDAVAMPAYHAHRRYVVSFAEYSFGCSGQGPPQALASLAAMASGTTVHSELVPESRLGEDTAEARTPVSATVALRVGGRWTTLQPRFEVEPGDTLGTVLGREGDKVYVDLLTGEGYALREIYVAVGADLDRPVTTVSEALAPLEARNADIAGLRVVRGRLDALLTTQGSTELDATHGGSPASAGRLEIHALAGVDPQGAVADASAGMTIAGVAGLTRDAFVRRVRQRAPAPQRSAAAVDARAAWETANRVTDLATAWSSG